MLHLKRRICYTSQHICYSLGSRSKQCAGLLPLPRPLCWRWCVSHKCPVRHSHTEGWVDVTCCLLRLCALCDGRLPILCFVVNAAATLTFFNSAVLLDLNIFIALNCHSPTLTPIFCLSPKCSDLLRRIGLPGGVEVYKRDQRVN